jgi:hypothetical protein
MISLSNPKFIKNEVPQKVNNQSHRIDPKNFSAPFSANIWFNLYAASATSFRLSKSI